MSVRSRRASPIFRTPGVSRMTLKRSDQAISPDRVALGVLDVEAEVDERVRRAVRLVHAEVRGEVRAHAVAHVVRRVALAQEDARGDVDGLVDRVLHADLERERAGVDLGHLLEHEVLERGVGIAPGAWDCGMT